MKGKIKQVVLDTINNTRDGEFYYSINVLVCLLLFFKINICLSVDCRGTQTRGVPWSWSLVVCIALTAQIVCKPQATTKKPLITYVAGPNQLTLLLDDSAFRFVSQQKKFALSDDNVVLFWLVY